jgi:NCS1 family nucleobase:cation symporter-1
VYSHFSTFLAICGTFFGPLSGIYFVDYFILRRRKLDVRSLYFKQAGKPYYYWGGFNLSAIAAFVISTAVYFIILDPISFESSTAFLYLTASIPATVLGGLLHYFFSKMVVIPKKLGGYEHTAGKDSI